LYKVLALVSMGLLLASVIVDAVNR
jgi:hypothetical protein